MIENSILDKINSFMASTDNISKFSFVEDTIRRIESGELDKKDVRFWRWTCGCGEKIAIIIVNVGNYTDYLRCVCNVCKEVTDIYTDWRKTC